MEICKEKFEKLKQETKEYYDSLGEIECPYFGEKVSFSSEGFQHLLYKGESKIKERDKNSQYMRLKLFKLASKLLRKTTTVQEEFLDKKIVEIKLNKRKVKVPKDVRYWGFIAIIDGWKIKVVIKQVGAGHKKFWSIVPNWKTRRSREDKKDEVKFLNYSGDPEED